MVEKKYGISCGTDIRMPLMYTKSITCWKHWHKVLICGLYKGMNSILCQSVTMC